MEEINVKLDLKQGFKILLLFMIRITEVFVSSLVPSMVGIFLILINPNQRIWDICVIFSLVAFLAVNTLSLYKYMRDRPDKKEFFIINGMVYFLFAGVSTGIYIAMRNVVGALFYSILFSNMRFFEVLVNFRIFSFIGRITTLESILSTNALILVVLFIACFVCSAILKKQRQRAIENGANEVEMETEKVIPVQNDKVVSEMSVASMIRHMDKEIIEAQKERQKLLDEQPEGLWNDKIIKGRGEKIEYYDPATPDDDFDANDVVAANSEDVGLGGNYSSEALWDDIYKGKDKVVEFPEDVTIPPAPQRKVGPFKALQYTIAGHVRSLMKFISIKINYRKNELFMRDINAVKVDRGGFNNNSYASESLWSNALYKGNDESNHPERVMDFDEEVTKRAETGLEDYDSDKLWNLDSDKVYDPEKEIEQSEGLVTNPNEEYDSDSLWDIDRTNLPEYKPGQIVDKDDINPTAGYTAGRLWNITRRDRLSVTNASIIDSGLNPFKDYDSDSLWGKITKGKENKDPEDKADTENRSTEKT